MLVKTPPSRHKHTSHNGMQSAVAAMRQRKQCILVHNNQSSTASTLSTMDKTTPECSRSRRCAARCLIRLDEVLLPSATNSTKTPATPPHVCVVAPTTCLPPFWPACITSSAPDTRAEPGTPLQHTPAAAKVRRTHTSCAEHGNTPVELKGAGHFVPHPVDHPPLHASARSACLMLPGHHNARSTLTVLTHTCNTPQHCFSAVAACPGSWPAWRCWTRPTQAALNLLLLLLLLLSAAAPTAGTPPALT